MGLFSHIKNSLAKSRLIEESGVRVESGDFGAIKDIYKHICSNPAFSHVLKDFDITEQDIEALVRGIMMSGHGARYGKHYVPVSAVLFPDTLSYLMRAERGTVSKVNAYFLIDDHFRKDNLVFGPEIALRR